MNGRRGDEHVHRSSDLHLQSLVLQVIEGAFRKATVTRSEIQSIRAGVKKRLTSMSIIVARPVVSGFQTTVNAVENAVCWRVFFAIRTSGRTSDPASEKDVGIAPLTFPVGCNNFTLTPGPLPCPTKKAAEKDENLRRNGKKNFKNRIWTESKIGEEK